MFKYLPLCLVFLAVSCTGANQTLKNVQNKFEIQPVFEGDFTNHINFMIDPSIENELMAPNGSRIVIPANCLVSQSGEVVKGEVSITLDQYHSLADIMASGIPMSIDSAGTTYDFKSAGMFTIKGACKGEEVFVREGELLTVDLASDKQEKYNFYKLNDSGEWNCEKRDQVAAINPDFNPGDKVIKPEKANDEAFILDLNFDRSGYKELDVFKSVVWEYTGNHDSLDPRTNQWINKERWNDISLKETYEQAYEYWLTLKNKNKNFTTKVKVALDGEDFDMAMTAFNSKKLELAKRADELSKPYVRSVSISGFGTYNHDYINRVPEPAILAADFNFGAYNDEKDMAVIVVVYEEEDVLVNYRQSRWQSFGLDTEKNPKIMAVLPGNKVAVCTQDVSRSFSEKEFTYDMNVLDKTIESKTELIDILSTL